MSIHHAADTEAPVVAHEVNATLQEPDREGEISETRLRHLDGLWSRPPLAWAIVMGMA